MKLNYKNDVWNPWTEKSIGISFKSNQTAVGDGESKLGYEFGTEPLGQNFSYDLDVCGEQWEVKKLDDDNSFRMGIEVSDGYRKIINTVISIFNKLKLIEGLMIDSILKNQISSFLIVIHSIVGRGSTILIDGLNKNEVSAANLNATNDIIESLRGMINLNTQREIILYNSVDGKKNNYDVVTAYKKLKLEKLSPTEQMKYMGCNKELFNKIVVMSHIKEDIQLFKNKGLKSLLNDLVRGVFNETKLVLVSKEKGFKPIYNMETIFCNRITSGKPRCKLNI